MANRTTRIDPEQIRKIAAQLPLGRDPGTVRRRIEAMEQLLEGLITIPGFNRKIGLDVILDFIPVAGPTIAAAMGGWMMWEARNLGMTKTHMARMAGNIGFDYLLGLIPWIGAVPDFFFRSNTRNLKMIKRFLDHHHPATAIIQG
ncbi:MAG: DUF4112 domain-containing protein [Sphingomonas sp.]|nr:DUF4112 domain-containing protein [Sphingomonas sp.]